MLEDEEGGDNMGCGCRAGRNKIPVPRKVSAATRNALRRSPPQVSGLGRTIRDISSLSSNETVQDIEMAKKHRLAIIKKFGK